MLAVPNALALQFARIASLSASILLGVAPRRRLCCRRHQDITYDGNRHSVVETHLPTFSLFGSTVAANTQATRLSCDLFRRSYTLQMLNPACDLSTLGSVCSDECVSSVAVSNELRLSTEGRTFNP
jgi:hypothetical protein